MSTPRKTKRKGQEASITVSEFKQWLSGVEDMQEDDWVPDASQWAKIRAKVELISEDEYPAVPVASTQPSMPLYDARPVAPIPNGYSGLVDPMEHYRQRASMLPDDGIMMPAPDSQANGPDIGFQHGTNQFG